MSNFDYTFSQWGGVKLLLVLASVLLAVLLIQLIRQMRRRSATMKQLSRMQWDYFDSRSRQSEALLALQDDMDQNIAAVVDLVQQGKDAAAEDYIAGMTGRLEQMRTLAVNTGNDVADAVLTEKAAHCRKKEIAFSLEGGLPQQTGVEPYEMVSLLSNLLDNAIEAAERAREHKVSVSLSAQAGVMRIQVQNTAAEDARFGGTTKQDEAHHGNGLRIMRRIAARHGGSVQTRVQDGRACVEITMLSE